MNKIHSMRIIKAISIIFIFSTLASCSTRNISKQPIVDIKEVSNLVSIDVHGEKIQPQIIDMLSRELKGQLILSGFDIVEDIEGNHIALNVDVSEFSPGNTALRLTVGFGAGRGSLIYTAEYVDRDGKVLAKMDGQERFTGGEISFNQKYGMTTGFGGADKVTIVLVKEAASHIVKLSTGKQP